MTNKMSKTVIIGSILCSLVLLGVLSTFAYILLSPTETKENLEVEAGSLSLTFADGNNGITQALEFGKSVTKTFTITNNGTLDAVAMINFVDIVNTYTDGSLTYSLSFSETENGKYTDVVIDENVPRSENADTIELANGLEIQAGKTMYYKLVIKLNYLDDVDQTADLKAMFSSHFEVEEGIQQGLVPKIVRAIVKKTTLPKSDYIHLDTKPDFSQIADTDEGIFTMEDDYGASYYFRGAVENNYVKFANFYWRIIRVNGNGSVRLIYDGTKAYPNGEMDATDKIGPVKYNNSKSDVKYVGYMYGPKGSTSSTSVEQAQSNLESSNIKIELEKWYKNNIYDKGFDNYTSDTLFCNDRGIYSGNGYGQKSVTFNLDNRLISNINPSLFCEQQNDRFTVNDMEIGNGNLDYPVALITADEASLVGAVIAKENDKFYLYKKFGFWTMSPRSNSTTNPNNFVINDYYAGMCFSLQSRMVSESTIYLLPVISLTPEYFQTLIGDGTMTNPYHLPTESIN